MRFKSSELYSFSIATLMHEKTNDERGVNSGPLTCNDALQFGFKMAAKLAFQGSLTSI